MKFIDRTDAGRKLAEMMEGYKGSNAILLGIPRGGVPVACAIAQRTGLPLHLLLMKKIGHPQNREYSIGAAGVEDSYIFPTAGVPDQYVKHETDVIRAKLTGMQRAFPGFADMPNLERRTVVIVDDGIATGNTVLAAIHMLRRRNPAHVIVATPVISRSAAVKLGSEADEVISLYIPQDFSGLSRYYEDFRQLTDKEVRDHLGRLHQGALERA